MYRLNIKRYFGSFHLSLRMVIKRAQGEKKEYTRPDRSPLWLCDCQCVGYLVFYQSTLLHTTVTEPEKSTYLNVERKAVIVDKDGLRFPAWVFHWTFRRGIPKERLHKFESQQFNWLDRWFAKSLLLTYFNFWKEWSRWWSWAIFASWVSSQLWLSPSRTVIEVKSSMFIETAS